MNMKGLGMVALCAALITTAADARVVRLEIQRREPILSGKLFGGAGSYEKLVGKVHFALDPKAAINSASWTSTWRPGMPRAKSNSPPTSSCSSPVDPKKGNHRLFYEVGNRGGKSMLGYFQKAKNSKDPTLSRRNRRRRLDEPGLDLALDGLAMGRADRPDAHGPCPSPPINGKKITGLVRGNFIPNDHSPTQPLADRNHFAYPIDDPNAPDNVMTVRDNPADPPQMIPRAKWHFVGRLRERLAGWRLSAGTHL